MGLFRSIKSMINKDRQPGSVVAGVSGGGSKAGVYISEENSMRYAAVQACVRVLSEDIAALPLYLYRRTGQGGKERAADHPLYPLLRLAPNPEMTAIAFKEALMVNVLLTGNAYAFIEMNGAGRVMALWPMMSSEVQPYRTEAGAIRYRAGRVDLSAAEVLHIPGLGYDGLMGMSPISYARETIGLGIAAEEFGGQFFKNGTHLGGVITVPGHLSDDSFERTKTQFQQMYRGLQNSHGVPLLEGGATYQQVGIAPEDAQFLETRKYQRSEIAGIFRVPPHMVGDLEHATFSNIEHQDISYLQRSLLPWLTRIEQNMTQKLLTAEEKREYVIEHETGSFMRGDTKSRFEAYAIGIQNGILSVNEARSKENLNPVDGGDEILRPLNMDVVGKDDGAGGEDGPGSGGTRAITLRRLRRQLSQRESQGEDAGEAFHLADVSHFTTDTRRRGVGRSSDAAGDMGLSAAQRKALKTAFAKWLTWQAGQIRKIVEKITGQRDTETAKKITAALNAFWKDVRAEGMPGDIKAAVESATRTAWDRVRADVQPGEADVIDEKWMRGYFEQYYAGMEGRLIDANEAAVRKLLGGATEEEIDNLYEKLTQWPENRADLMERTEAAMAVNEAMVAGYRAAGYYSVWQAAPGCCRICVGMNGQIVTTLKPPLHKGCGCGVARGVKRDEEIDTLLRLENERINELIEHPERALPNVNEATIADGKFKGYLFNRQNLSGWAKGVAFTSRLGYNEDNWEELRAEIERIKAIFPVTIKAVLANGITYNQSVILHGVKGRPANVIVGWIVEEGDTHLTSLYLKEVKNK